MLIPVEAQRLAFFLHTICPSSPLQRPFFDAIWRYQLNDPYTYHKNLIQYAKVLTRSHDSAQKLKDVQSYARIQPAVNQVGTHFLLSTYTAKCSLNGSEASSLPGWRPGIREHGSWIC